MKRIKKRYAGEGNENGLMFPILVTSFSRLEAAKEEKRTNVSYPPNVSYPHLLFYACSWKPHDVGLGRMEILEINSQAKSGD